MLLKGCLTDFELSHETKGTLENPTLQGKTPQERKTAGRKVGRRDDASKEIVRVTKQPSCLLCLDEEANTHIISKHIHSKDRRCLVAPEFPPRSNTSHSTLGTQANSDRRSSSR